MSFKAFIQKIRNKPQRVRERIVLVLVVVISPVLFIVWSLTFHSADTGNSGDFVKTIGSTISGTFSNPVYKDTFGSPGATKQ